ncbi:MAG: hypothetical protein COA67_12280 [Lutibacter sp.]|nr:MAG: hypothetical protein COA67_12280 [Lutibacter sp.]
MKKVFLILAIFCVSIINAQETKKSVTTKRVSNPPKIDGKLDDSAWDGVEIATNFVMFRPERGTPAPENIKTKVKIVYDDEAIYFGAYLYDDKPEEIPMEFQTRDNFGNADFFGVVINPLNDGQNQTEFFVMSTGNQNDAKVLSNGREDFSWNAVWDSKVSMVDDGWIVEMKIPYSALRFSNDDVQTWALNFHRHHRKNRDQYTWNFIPQNEGHIAQYDGILNGIKNIEPPLRLSFNPYASATVSSFAGDTEFDWSAGLDVKYGINDSFTLDATLIPDFGQTRFDDVTLNLGPFEQRFSEQRAFFNEGTDLFNKGGFFFSRRIGNTPVGIDLVDEIDEDNSILIQESIPNYPRKVDVLNIVKISGRNKNGLGIGVLNAITKKTSAEVERIETLLDGNNTPILDINNNPIIETSYRNEVVEPLANYSVLVLDQQFNKNSSVTLVNTNVLRNGNFRDANVTGLLFDLKTKDNKYGVDGGIAMSNIYNGNGQKPVTGLEGSLEVGKISGKHQYDLELGFKNKRYDKNDLGFLRTNNEMEISSSYSFNQTEPKGKLNSYFLGFWGNAEFLMEVDETSPAFAEKSSKYSNNRFGMNARFHTKKQLGFGANINSSFGNQYNYYEPRIPGRFFKEKPTLGFNNWISSDYSKKFAVDVNYFYSLTYGSSRSFFNFNVSPRYRVSNQLSFQYRFGYNKGKSQKGYVNIDNSDDIIFGVRETKSITNSLSGKYNFSTKSALSLSIRQYWSPVTYEDQYFKLENDGTLSENAYSANHDVNFNTWNLDLNYLWEFAPGSQLVALYRNNAFNIDDQSDLKFGKNIKNLFKQNIGQTFSVKLVYYLDYNKLKTWV